MNAKQMFSALGLYLFTGVLVAANTAGAPWFEVHTSGAETLTLRGAAEFGAVKGVGTGPFVLTLGAESPTGAVVFTWADDNQPEPGVYDVSEASATGIRALIVTGPATRPTGAFRGRVGALTLTRSNRDVIQGSFELEAVGFEAADTRDEGRQLIVRGTFSARPSQR